MTITPTAIAKKSPISVYTTVCPCKTVVTTINGKIQTTSLLTTMTITPSVTISTGRSASEFTSLISVTCNSKVVTRNGKVTTETSSTTLTLTPTARISNKTSMPSAQPSSSVVSSQSSASKASSSTASSTSSSNESTTASSSSSPQSSISSSASSSSAPSASSSSSVTSYSSPQSSSPTASSSHSSSSSSFQSKAQETTTGSSLETKIIPKMIQSEITKELTKPYSVDVTITSKQTETGVVKSVETIYSPSTVSLNVTSTKTDIAKMTIHDTVTQTFAATQTIVNSITEKFVSTVTTFSSRQILSQVTETITSSIVATTTVKDYQTFFFTSTANSIATATISMTAMKTDVETKTFVPIASCSTAVPSFTPQSPEAQCAAIFSKVSKASTRTIQKSDMSSVIKDTLKLPVAPSVTTIYASLNSQADKVVAQKPIIKTRSIRAISSSLITATVKVPNVTKTAFHSTVCTVKPSAMPKEIIDQVVEITNSQSCE